MHKIQIFSFSFYLVIIEAVLLMTGKNISSYLWNINRLQINSRVDLILEYWIIISREIWSEHKLPAAASKNGWTETRNCWPTRGSNVNYFAFFDRYGEILNQFLLKLIIHVKWKYFSNIIFIFFSYFGHHSHLHVLYSTKQSHLQDIWAKVITSFSWQKRWWLPKK